MRVEAERRRGAEHDDAAGDRPQQLVAGQTDEQRWYGRRSAEDQLERAGVDSLLERAGERVDRRRDEQIRDRTHHEKSEVIAALALDGRREEWVERASDVVGRHDLQAKAGD